MKKRQLGEVVMDSRRAAAVVGMVVGTRSSLGTVGMAAAAGRLATGRGNGQERLGSG
jgi:hypothetical protein